MVQIPMIVFKREDIPANVGLLNQETINDILKSYGHPGACEIDNVLVVRDLHRTIVSLHQHRSTMIGCNDAGDRRSLEEHIWGFTEDALTGPNKERGYMVLVEERHYGFVTGTLESLGYQPYILEQGHFTNPNYGRVR